MQEIIINLPFDQDSFLDTQNIKWQISKKRKEYSNYIFYQRTLSIVLILFLIALAFRDIKSYDPAFMGLTLFLILYNIIAPWVSIYQNKRKFFRLSEVHATQLKQKGHDAVFTLNEELLSYEDAQRSIKMQWALFQPFYIFKDAIILTSSSIVGNTIIIQKAQIDEATYIQLIDLLTKTIGRGKGI